MADQPDSIAALAAEVLANLCRVGVLDSIAAAHVERLAAFVREVDAVTRSMHGGYLQHGMGDEAEATRAIRSRLGLDSLGDEYKAWVDRRLGLDRAP